MNAHDKLQLLTLMESIREPIPPELANLTAAQTTEARRAAEREVSALDGGCEETSDEIPCCRAMEHPGEHIFVMTWRPWRDD